MSTFGRSWTTSSNRELILLESPPGPGVPGASDQQDAAPGGIKREAGDELAIPSAIRRRVD